jgi:hypothetical protein
MKLSWDKKSHQYMILPSWSRMWTDCPSDCSTPEYCHSGSAKLGPTSPAPVARPSCCSGDDCGNDCDPRDMTCGPPSKPSDRCAYPAASPWQAATAAACRASTETDCECRRSAPLGMNLDISCLSCSCPISSFRIFIKSSSPLDSIPTDVLTATDVCSPSKQPGHCLSSRPPQRRLL